MKSAPHVTLDEQYIEIFDMLAERLETRLLPRYSRSGLLNKAAQLWVATMKEDRPDLKAEIEQIELRHETARQAKNRRGKSRKNVVPMTRSASPKSVG